jgi:hypothetical protein
MVPTEVSGNALTFTFPTLPGPRADGELLNSADLLPSSAASPLTLPTLPTQITATMIQHRTKYFNNCRLEEQPDGVAGGNF